MNLTSALVFILCFLPSLAKLNTETPSWKVKETHSVKIHLRGQVNVSLILESLEPFSPNLHFMGNSLSLSWRNDSIALSVGPPLPKGRYVISIDDNCNQIVLTVNPSKFECQASFTKFDIPLNKLRISSSKGTFYSYLNCDNNKVSNGQKDAPKCECGMSSISVPGLSRRAKREIGGEAADSAEYPWQVLIQLNNNTVSCGGSLIKRNWVLSAAHCFSDDPRPIDMTLKLGFQGLNSDNIGDIIFHYNSEDMRQNVIIHPQFDNQTGNNDIALIQLKQAVTWTPYVKPICLAAAEDIQIGQKAISTGWGVTNKMNFGLGQIYYGGPAADLQEVVLDVISLTQCRNVNWGSLKITDNMICTYTEEKSTCYGDSGGPLITQLEDGRWAQIGIVSFGYGCAESVYTKVPNYRNWIDELTGSHEC